MSDRIHVAIRVRPLNAREAVYGQSWSYDKEEISQVSADLIRTGSTYTFDRIYGEGEDSNHIFDYTANDIVSSVLQGVNGTIFAYGQTASGKTFTMRGNEQQPGIIPLSIGRIFQCIENAPNMMFLIRVSYLEIYNEIITDLLNPENTHLKIHEDIERGVFVGNIKEEVVTESWQVMSILSRGEVNRKVGSTNMTEYSSRSHSIFRMEIESCERSKDVQEELVLTGASKCCSSRSCFKSDNPVKVSFLNLVDLAGSERAILTGAEGMRLKEGSHINKSLLTLERVISKLSEKSKGTVPQHIPFRDSKLTRILQPALGGNSRTAIICTITPSVLHQEESHSTLKFANSAKKISNKPQVNEVLDEKTLLKRYRSQISTLEQQVAQFRSHPAYGLMIPEGGLIDLDSPLDMIKSLSQPRHLIHGQSLDPKLGKCRLSNGKSRFSDPYIDDTLSTPPLKQSMLLGSCSDPFSFDLLNSDSVPELEPMNAVLNDFSMKPIENHESCHKIEHDLLAQLESTKLALTSEREKLNQMQVMIDESSLKDGVSQEKINSLQDQVDELEKAIKDMTDLFEEEEGLLIQEQLKVEETLKQEIEALKLNLESTSRCIPIEVEALLEDQQTQLEKQELDLQHHETIMAEQDQKVASLTQQLQVTEVSLSVSHDHIKSLEEELKVVQLQYTQSEEKVKQMLADFEAIQMQIQKLEWDLDISKVDKQVLETEYLSKMEEAKALFDEQLQGVQQEHIQKEIEMNDLKSQFDMQRVEYETLVQNLVHEKQVLLDKIEVFNQISDQYEAIVQEDQSKDLGSKEVVEMNKYILLQEENERYKVQLEDLQSRLDHLDKDDHVYSLKDINVNMVYENKVAALEKELAENQETSRQSFALLNSQLASYEQNITQLRLDKSCLETQLSAIEQKDKNKKDEIDRLTSQLTNIEHELSGNNAILTQNDDTVASLRKRNNQLQTALTLTEQTNEKLASQMKQLEKDRKHSELLPYSLEEKQEQILMLEEKCAMLSKENAKITSFSVTQHEHLSATVEAERQELESKFTLAASSMAHISQLEEQIRHLTKELESMRSNKYDNADSVSAWISKVKSLEKELDAMEGKFSASSIRASENEILAHDHETRYKQSQNELRSLRDQFEAVCHKHKSDKTALNDQIHDLEALNGRLRSENEDLDRELTNYSKQMDGWHSRVEEYASKLQQTLQERKEVESQCVLIQERCTNIASELESVQSREKLLKKRHEMEMKNVAEELTTIKKESKLLTQKKISIEKENDNLHRDLEKLQAQFQTQKDKSQISTQEKSSLIQENATYEREFKSLRVKADGMERELKKYQGLEKNQDTKMKELTWSLTQAEKKGYELVKMNEKLEKNFDLANAEIAKLKSEMEKVGADLTKSLLLYDKSKNEYHELRLEFEETSLKLVGHQMKLEEIVSILARKEHDLEQCQSLLEDTTMQLNTVKNELATRTDQVEELGSCLENDKRSLIQQMDQTQLEMNQLIQERDGLVLLVEKVQHLPKELSDLANDRLIQLEELQQSYEKQSAENEQLTLKLKALGEDLVEILLKEEENKVSLSESQREQIEYQSQQENQIINLNQVLDKIKIEYDALVSKHAIEIQSLNVAIEGHLTSISSLQFQLNEKSTQLMQLMNEQDQQNEQDRQNEQDQKSFDWNELNDKLVKQSMIVDEYVAQLEERDALLESNQKELAHRIKEEVSLKHHLLLNEQAYEALNREKMESIANLELMIDQLQSQLDQTKKSEQEFINQLKQVEEDAQRLSKQDKMIHDLETSNALLLDQKVVLDNRIIQVEMRLNDLIQAYECEQSSHLEMLKNWKETESELVGDIAMFTRNKLSESNLWNEQFSKQEASMKLVQEELERYKIYGRRKKIQLQQSDMKYALLHGQADKLLKDYEVLLKKSNSSSFALENKENMGANWSSNSSSSLS